MSTLSEQLTHLAAERELSAERKEAWEQFLKEGLPDKRSEMFRYVILRELYEQPFYKSHEESICAITPVDPDTCRFVLVDGKLSKSLSKLDTLPKEVVFCTMKEAERSYGFLLRSKVAKMLKEGRKHSLSLLNYALHDEGLFLYIPPKLICKNKIEIVEVYSSKDASLYFPKISIYIGKQAEVDFEFYVDQQSSPTHFITRSTELHLDMQSLCRINTHFLNMKNCWYFDQVAISLKRDARCFYVSGDIGSKSLRQDFKVDLLEENAEVSLKGLSILKKKDQSHQCVQVNHLAPNCRSSQHFKGVVFDQAVLSFEGKIWVDQIAQKTEAYQLSNQLLLGEQARAYSKPNLEIFADDVKASHGATTMQLNKEEIFYLRARGLTLKEAKKILIQGFCKTLMEEMTSSSKEIMLRYLQEGLNI